ncbi:carbon-nitrogen hydrolase family protein [Sneathiella sp. HT1-7]|jgi:predicted amidohydrolase|uniref:carbon-nitrogen hydrolase family protein n=1 Tax=Sneathiella sp. HT1-7 TaxID=2887192 RepID=UPI001D14D723|nr:carbon-nitrogen hydrolase family protein [Sneathiella sp. HT1-7]MCC3305217.1 carbon-nitrogen hydrolase family protein [Sneathiella sp. HT1-7]
MTEDIKLKLAVVQMDCAVGDIGANLRKIGRFAETAGEQNVDLAIFPECATTGYFISDDLAHLAEPKDGPTDQELSRIAAKSGIHMAIGTVVEDGGKFYNAQVLFSPTGKRLATYYKAHLFSAERLSYELGNTPTVVDTDLGRIGMTICYDMIFPDYFRTLVNRGAEIIINSTNWISDAYQRDVWGWSGVTTQGMAATRALENGVIVAMANRTGTEMGFDSLGHSCIIAPSGHILASIPNGEGIAIADLDFKAEDIEKWRSVATYRQDRRPELYD